MSSNNYSNYINSLIQYIVDTKPYHCKLTEILEEYHFDDSFNVKIDDSLHTIKSKFSSVWNGEFYSDGVRTFYKLPSPILGQRHSSAIGRDIVTLASLDLQIPNLSSVNASFQTSSDTVAKLVTVNSQNKTEGVDYHVSKGAASYYVRKNGSVYEYIERPYYEANVLGFVWKKADSTFLNVVSSTAPDEVWTLIKTNPISVTEPMFYTQAGPSGHSIGFGMSNYDSGGDDISCSQDGPDGDNYYYSIQYDQYVGAHIGELFDDSLHCFDLSQLNFSLSDPTAPSEVWTISTVSATEFSVVGSVSGPKPNATLDVPYDNGIVNFTLTINDPLYVPKVDADILVYEVINPAPRLYVYQESCWSAPAESWTIKCISATEFEVVGSVSGVQPHATIDSVYSNGIVKFQIFSRGYTFPIGSLFRFSVLADKPSYLVHGSVSGMQKPATVGVPYNNGIISFTINSPSVANVKDFGSGLSFASTPIIRPDASDEKIVIIPVSSTTAMVISSRRGMLKSATIGVEYQDELMSFRLTGTPTVSTFSANELNVDAFINVLNGTDPNPLHTATYLTFSIIGSQFKPTYAKDLLIFGKVNFRHEQIDSISSAIFSPTDVISIDDIREDGIRLKYVNNSTLFGSVINGTNVELPIFVETDNTGQSIVKLLNVGSSLVETVGTLTAEGYAIELDPSFVSHYLPINVGFTLTVSDKELYNQSVSALFSDEIRFADSFRFEDHFNVKITDAIYFSGSTGKISDSFTDSVRISMLEQSRLTIEGYGIYDYDAEPNGDSNLPNDTGFYDLMNVIDLGTMSGIGTVAFEEQNQTMGASFDDSAFMVYTFTEPAPFDIGGLDKQGLDLLSPPPGFVSTLLKEFSIPNIGSPFFNDITFGSVQLSYVEISSPRPNITIGELVLDYIGSQNLSTAPTVFILDNLIDRNILEIINPQPMRTGITAYNSFKLILSNPINEFVVVVTA